MGRVVLENEGLWEGKDTTAPSLYTLLHDDEDRPCLVCVHSGHNSGCLLPLASLDDLRLNEGDTLVALSTLSVQAHIACRMDDSARPLRRPGFQLSCRRRRRAFLRAWH